MRFKNLSAYEVGRWGEEIALKYLKKRGYKIIEKGFRLFRGEIDIIAYDKKTLVFVEVKTRRDSRFGLPEESVTQAKMKQIRKISLGFLTNRNIGEVECRFDVIAIILNGNKGYSVSHIKNAF